MLSMYICALSSSFLQCFTGFQRFGQQTVFRESLICYVWQWYWGRNFIDQPTWICSTCHVAKHARGDRSCECGGKFEDIEWWKWTDDESMA